jgi:hypothetical protein
MDMNPPDEAQPELQRRPKPKSRTGRRKLIQLIVAVVVVCLASLGAVIMHFIKRASAPVEDGGYVRTPVPLSQPSKTSRQSIRELGLDAVATKIGLETQNVASNVEEPAGPAYNTTIKNVELTFSNIPNDAPKTFEARSALDAYLAAPTWRDKLAFVLRSARSEDSMREYYEKRAGLDPQPREFVGAGLITAGESKVVTLRFNCPERLGSALAANFHLTPDGRMLLDWESWAGFSEMAWPDLKKEKPVVPTLVRAIAEESDYYNYEFTEQGRWLAVKLRSPDGVQFITGYCERRSGTGIALANLIGVPVPQVTEKDKPTIPIRRPGTKTKVTVRIAFPTVAQSDHCVNITQLLADRWMLFDGEL